MWFWFQVCRSREPRCAADRYVEGEEEKGEEGGERPVLSRMYTSKPEFDSAKAEAKAARGGGGMPEDTATLQRELERYRLKNESLTTDLNMALQNKQGGVGGASRGFSLLHLLITGAYTTYPDTGGTLGLCSHTQEQNTRGFGAPSSS